MSGHLVQIVPNYPPAIDGVGDYASLLANGLRSRYATSIVNCAPGANGAVEGVYQIKSRDSDELASLVTSVLHATRGREAAVLLIQYSGYGYAKRGYPKWFIDAVCRLRGCFPDVPFATFFHELFAFGPPWRSSFWLCPFQRRAASQLARLSDFVLTNTSTWGRWLRRYIGTRSEVLVLPVPSNVGEPLSTPKFDVRSNRLVVFGKAPTRKRLYHCHASELCAVVDALGADEVLDVGEPTSIPEQLSGIPVRSTGLLGCSETSEILAGSRFGALSLPANLLGKSGVFAAYAAHGVVAIRLGGSDESSDGFRPGLDHLDRSVEFGTLSPLRLRDISTRAQQQYQTHNQAAHIAQMRDMLGQSHGHGKDGARSALPERVAG